MGEKHDRAATKLAKKLGTQHRRNGVDILSKGKAIEVAITKSDIYTSIRQLKRSRAPRKFLAVPSSQASLARRLLMKSGIGVMNLRGKVLKRTRKCKRR
jgi:hypothetical protein